MRLRDLRGLGPQSEKDLERIGIASVETFIKTDPMEMFLALKHLQKNVNRNFLYALIGAQQNRDWREVAQEMKSKEEIS